MLLHIMVCMDVWIKITLRSTILLQAGACDAIHTHTTVSHAFRTKPGVTDVKCRLASGSHMRALTPGAPAPPAVNTRQGGVHTGTAAPTGAPELAFSHSRLPATLPTHAYPTFFNSHHPPRLPPKKCGARMALPRVLQHALDGASLGSISAPPQHAH